MKLLGWMHRKFRQNSGDVFKDFTTGPTCNCLSGRPSLEEHRQLSPIVPARIHPPMRDQQLFSEGEFMLQGLLTIGTLGTGPIEESAAAEVEAIAEKEETEATTETELMVVSAELEKVIAAEAEKEGGGDKLSSARPSYVSGRASEAFPLQGYLLGSAVEVAEERKERRPSLVELFMKEERSEKEEEEERVVGDGRSGLGVQVMVKKMLKLRGSGGGSRRSGDVTTTAIFHKILQIFHRKVHPENNIARKKPMKYSSKHENKDATAPCNGGNCLVGGGGNKSMTASKRTCRKEGITSFISDSDPPSLSLGGSDSMINREYWIKTDADYVVLELQKRRKDSGFSRGRSG